MNFRKPTIADLIEGVGMLGITGSLLFVGIEVSQNSSIARTASYQSYISGFTVLNLAQINNNSLNALMVKASHGISVDEFTLEERRKLRLFYITLLRQWEGLYHSVQEGILPDEMLTIVGAGHLLGYRAFTEMWPDIKLLFTEDFCAFIDSINSNKINS
jgi:hypothetical protein